jgi:hypothetical protein
MASLKEMAPLSTYLRSTQITYENIVLLAANSFARIVNPADRFFLNNKYTQFLKTTLAIAAESPQP